MNMRIKLILFISFLFIVAIGNSILTFTLEHFGEQKLKWVNHTHEVIITTDNFLGAMKDMQRGQRGFIITNNLDYLEPYHAGVIIAENNFAKLKSLTSDNAVQQERLEIINKWMQLAFKEYHSTIKLVEHGDNTKAIEIVKQKKGKKYMDEIKVHIDKFINVEMLLLEKRKGDFREHRAKITTIIVVEIVFFVFLAFMTLSFLNKNLFHPLRLLLSSTQKMEDGKKLEIEDITSNDEMGYLLSSFYKMNEKVHARTKKLDYKAHHDELTGLQNRTNLYKEIENSIKISKERDTKSAILFIDLNKFKPINDTLGHDVGDAILVETAKRLKSVVRSNDIVFRIGGDEFLVLIKDISDSAYVEMILSKILKAFSKTATFQGNELKIELSIGVSILPDNSEEADELVKMADIAMYEAKKDKEISYKIFDKEMCK